MPADPDPSIMPVGPGGHEYDALRAGGTCPGFETDPLAWFRWLQSAIATGSPIDGALRAATWSDSRGRAWRVVVTPDGPEVRPGFDTPSLVERDLPIVSAILIAPPVLHVELTWRAGQEVRRLGTDEASVLDLGLAMLTATELPHESIARLGPETWRRARERWERLEAAREETVS